jgi:hypothetical protein
MATKLNPIVSLTKTDQLALMKDINKVLKKHAVSGAITQFHVKSGTMVCACKKLPNGKIICA